MFNLTSSEKKTLIFVVIVLIASGFFQLFQPYKTINSTIDYSKSDSTFRRLSKISTHPKADTISPETESTAVISKKLSSKKENDKERKRTINKITLSSININTASSNELQKLPRIGPVMADRIIEYRNKYGNFKNTDDLIKVKGIGKKTLEKILPYISFN